MRYGQNRGAAAKHLDRAIGLVVPHGTPRELEEVREVDPDGRIVVHSRTRRHSARTHAQVGDDLDEAMYDAARAFQADFTIARSGPDPRGADAPGAGRRRRAGPQRAPARMRGDGCTRRCRRWVGSAALAAAVCGSCRAAAKSYVSGRCGKAGAGGRCGRNRRRVSSSLRWGTRAG